MMTRWMVAAAVLAAAVPAKAAGDAQFMTELAGARAAFRAAQAGSGSTVLSDRTSDVSVALGPTTVKCSAQGYSMPNLKVLVPALAGITLLDHRNAGEGAPCIAAGRCVSGDEPLALLARPGQAVETIHVRVTLKKETRLEGEVCHVTLVENVVTAIRGVPFFHERRQDVADRVPADCR
jgi:hypothetical protein